MVNQRTAAALLVAVVLSGADARPTAQPNKMADLHREDGQGIQLLTLTRRPTSNHLAWNAFLPVPLSDQMMSICVLNEWNVIDYVAHVATPVLSEPKPTCDDNYEAPEPQPKPEPKPEPPTCSTCEEPAPEPEPKSELTCNKAHGVQEGETCYCLAQGMGLTLDDFLGFNPNICCDNLFIGQWVCLNATSGCHDWL